MIIGFYDFIHAYVSYKETSQQKNDSTNEKATLPVM